MSSLIFIFTLVFGSEYLKISAQTESHLNENSNLNNEIPNLRLLPFPYARHLAKVEEELFKYMSAYEDILKARLLIVSSYVKDYRESSLKGTAHLDERNEPLAKATLVASHPLMYYRMMKRFSNEIIGLKLDLSRDVETDLVQKILGLTGKVAWPTIVDEEEATLALLRLQYVYEMDLKQLTTGNIAGIQTPLELNAKESFNIAKYASYVNFHTLAMEWLLVATWKTAAASKRIEAIDANLISTAYQDIIAKHNKQMEETNNAGTMFTFTRPITDTNLPQKKRNVDSKRLFKTKPLNPQQYLERSESEIFQRTQLDFLTLCNGKLLQNKAVKSQLHCYYDNKRHPYWYLNPLKTEVLNFEPRLVQIYEFIGEKAIDYLLLKAQEYSQSPVDPSHYLSPGNVVYAWLNDSDIPETKISNKIELYTGLNVVGSRVSVPLQVATLTVGSHEALHVDFINNTAGSNYDRASTFLIYLSNVDKGGFTAFPILGTFARPVTGSAIFWLNTYRNGNVDSRMIHGICPPILGYQWIARKWSYQQANFLRMPCDLNPQV